MRHFGRRSARTVVVLAAGVLAAATGAAAGPAVSTTMTVAYGGSNACTGESFTGTGDLHFVTTENLSATGNIQFLIDARFDGLKAVTGTGKTYVVQDMFEWEFTISDASEETFDITAHFVRVGEDGTFVLGDDFYEYFRAHITASATGMVTAAQVSTSDPLDPCQ